jgi:hypothetical protein
MGAVLVLLIVCGLLGRRFTIFEKSKTLLVKKVLQTVLVLMGTCVIRVALKGEAI